jgi:polysaccharide export outer membrane protein
MTCTQSRSLKCSLLLLAIFSPMAISSLAQSTSIQDNPFSSGQTQQQQQQQPLDTSSQTLNSTGTQVGPKVLTQSGQNQTRDGQQDDNTQTDRNGRSLNLNRILPNEPVPLTGFQRLAAASVGRVLPIYGIGLFANVPSTFAPVDRIPVTPEYVIGPGDELLIRMWGQVTLDGHFTVDRSGNVYIPQVGAVQVAGVPFAKLTDYLRSHIGRTFRNFDLNVNIGQLRSIQIFVVGQARRPGSYTVSSLSSLVNALFASGGPAPTGSLRSVQVKRSGVTVTNFDLYDLLLHGDKSKDVPLQSGDVIYIPPVGPMVAVAGSVETPALYELHGESTVKEVLALAGGLSTLAQHEQVRVERIQHHDARTVLDIKLDASGLTTPLSDGDILEVTPLIDRFKEVVTLRGNVADPRRFAWFPGMRVRDLIPEKEALLTRDYWQQRNQLGLPVLDSTPDVRRYAPDAPVTQINGTGVGPSKVSAQYGLLNAQGQYAQPDSDLNVFGTNAPLNGGRPSSPTSNQSQSMATNDANGTNTANQNNVQQNNPVTPSDLSSDGNGRAMRAGTLSLQGLNTDQNGNNASASTVSAAVTGAAQRFPAKNAVILSAPEVDWAYSVIQRLNKTDLTSQLLPFNLGKVVLDGDNSENLELQPGDVITIFSKADIRVPQSQQTKYVRLEGEFLASGTYSVKPGETLRQLVSRVGGLTSNAYLYGSQFTRESTRVLQQQRLSDYASDLDRRIKLAQANSANNALNPQDSISDIAALQNARTVAARLHQLQATGRIVLNVQPDSKSAADIPDLPLEDGDAFVVPQVPSNVDVFGSVYTQNSFLYNPHLRAGDYIRQAGGGTRTADIKRAYIVRADGSIISRQYSSTLFTNTFITTHLFPGDAVIVPEQVDKRPMLRNLVDIATIVGQFGLGIAAINVL